MKNTYFKVIGQQTPNNKIVIISVVDIDFFGVHVPDQFELQAIKMAPTIYTGTYPQIKMNIETMKDRSSDMRGVGIAGIILKEPWYCVKQHEEDIFNIGIGDRKMRSKETNC